MWSLTDIQEAWGSLLGARAGVPTIPTTTTVEDPAPVRRSYLCLDCEVVEEGLTIDPVRCWACGSEDLLPGYYPRLSNPGHGYLDPA